jgi:hypothetical protein
MGPKTLAPIVLFVLFISTFATRAQHSERTVAPSFSPAWNDNSPSDRSENGRRACSTRQCQDRVLRPRCIQDHIAGRIDG